MVKVCENELLSITQFCEELSVSVATGQNWIKTGKITPAGYTDNIPYFDVNYLDKIKNSIINSESLLKSRRNKKYSSGIHFYKNYLDNNSNYEKTKKLFEFLTLNNIQVDENLRNAVLLNTSISLIQQKFSHEIQAENLLKDYLTNKINISEFEFLISHFTVNRTELLKIADKYSEIFSFNFEYKEGEDLLGFLYMNLQDLSERKASGMYYTPSGIVKKICENVFKNDRFTSISDPCCGSGNFLLQLPENIKFENIYAGDTDETAVAIARINLSLKFGIHDEKIIKEHIRKTDFIFEENNEKFDCIIGNPPWGVEFTNEEKHLLKQSYETAQCTNPESFDIVFEKAIKILNDNGKIAFVLPESVLNVKSHKNIRNVILRECKAVSVEYLDEVFSGVQCPSIIFELTKQKTEKFYEGTKVKYKNSEFLINTNRISDSESLNFLITDEEYNILQKIENISCKTTLKDNSEFALGIVTGDNKKILTNIKTSANEPVLKGTDIKKYFYKIPPNYIKYEPDSFQQTAPEKFYRAKEKLIYKFISKSPVFAYDNTQKLTLNSCNILIPKFKDLNIKYILAVLNSSVTEFYYRKNFRTQKILRSHLEKLPIPIVDKNIQNNIIGKIDKILSDPENYQLIESIDKDISKLYNLTPSEYKFIKCLS